ncbi:hypothetical protein RAJCM14343_3566 [Rhodococcus aetherivorans]|uniref:Uncharacterized protein n=1 Tax=Rhodococcus aetherivorans TaxID=191292 RepID=A0ABQ0YNZ7_9NOCA|nr:hypothetical protein RAJCM14343_3566 [Rhodococcus aetherivorans]CCW12617.1 hypothetical protein EBESD8_31670 [Rhodococcus aetherivorans]
MRSHGPVRRVVRYRPMVSGGARGADPAGPVALPTAPETWQARAGRIPDPRRRR